MLSNKNKKVIAIIICLVLSLLPISAEENEQDEQEQQQTEEDKFNDELTEAGMDPTIVTGCTSGCSVIESGGVLIVKLVPGAKITQMPKPPLDAVILNGATAELEEEGVTVKGGRLIEGKIVGGEITEISSDGKRVDFVAATISAEGNQVLGNGYVKDGVIHLNNGNVGKQEVTVSNAEIEFQKREGENPPREVHITAKDGFKMESGDGSLEVASGTELIIVEPARGGGKNIICADECRINVRGKFGSGDWLSSKASKWQLSINGQPPHTMQGQFRMNNGELSIPQETYVAKGLEMKVVSVDGIYFKPTLGDVTVAFLESSGDITNNNVAQIFEDSASFSSKGQDEFSVQFGFGDEDFLNNLYYDDLNDKWLRKPLDIENKIVKRDGYDIPPLLKLTVFGLEDEESSVTVTNNEISVDSGSADVRTDLTSLEHTTIRYAEKETVDVIPVFSECQSTGTTSFAGRTCGTLDINIVDKTKRSVNVKEIQGRNVELDKGTIEVSGTTEFKSGNKQTATFTMDKSKVYVLSYEGGRGAEASAYFSSEETQKKIQGHVGFAYYDPRFNEVIVVEASGTSVQAVKFEDSSFGDGGQDHVFEVEVDDPSVMIRKAESLAGSGYDFNPFTRNKLTCSETVLTVLESHPDVELDLATAVVNNKDRDIIREEGFLSSIINSGYGRAAYIVGLPTPGRVLGMEELEEKEIQITKKTGENLHN
ncbi:hypothetical protein ACFL0W_03275 [Nanoarchaeota archaeon]